MRAREASELNPLNKKEGSIAGQKHYRVTERELLNALEDGQFELHYQPQVDLRRGKIVGVEALLRWRHPVRGLMLPNDFIPWAERHKVIGKIEEWVLYEACEQNKKWSEAGYEPIVISVNISPIQFTQGRLPETIRTVLDRTGLPPDRLAIEITETMMIDVEPAIARLQEIKRLGVKISMDDFGKGYSSLFYLKRFPLDFLKIDRSFIRECTSDFNDATIVKTIISMAHHMDLQVIAEGVETKEQLIFLQENLCNGAQGYLFGKPVPAPEIESVFNLIDTTFRQQGVLADRMEKIWMEHQLHLARLDLEETLRKQQGMTLKFCERNGRFIHTMADGELLYRLGFVPEQIIGRQLRDFMPADAANEQEIYYRRAWNGETDVTYEQNINGIWYMASLRPVHRGGRVVEVIGSCIDITRRKQAEEELIHTKQLLESFIQNTLDAICIMDTEGRVMKVNRAFEQLYGWTEEELLGKEPPNVPAHLQEEMRSMNDSVKAGHAVKGLETVRTRKDGGTVRISLNLSPIRDENGKVVSIASSARVVSEKAVMCGQ
jgi:PAS domain S-box-containing protein